MVKGKEGCETKYFLSPSFPASFPRLFSFIAKTTIDCLLKFTLLFRHGLCFDMGCVSTWAVSECSAVASFHHLRFLVSFPCLPSRAHASHQSTSLLLYRGLELPPLSHSLLSSSPPSVSIVPLGAGCATSPLHLHLVTSKGGMCLICYYAWRDPVMSRLCSSQGSRRGDCKGLDKCVCISVLGVCGFSV